MRDMYPVFEGLTGGTSEEGTQNLKWINQILSELYFHQLRQLCQVTWRQPPSWRQNWVSTVNLRPDFRRSEVQVCVTTKIIGYDTGIWNTGVAGGKKALSARREGDRTYFKCVHTSTSTGYEQNVPALTEQKEVLSPQYWGKPEEVPEYSSLESKPTLPSTGSKFYRSSYLKIMKA
jgi:hypothetical protein